MLHLNKNDRRVRKTRKLLVQGFTQLMLKKEVKEITIKELTELVDVNRSTFYLYYKDIYDMLEQIEDELLNKFSESFNKFMSEASNYNAALHFFNFLFKFVQDNADMFKIFFGRTYNGYSFINKFKIAILASHPPVAENVICLYNLQFVMTGCIGAIQQWLEDGMEMPAQDMAQLVTDLYYSTTTNINQL